MRIFYLVEELKKGGGPFKRRRFYDNGDSFSNVSAQVKSRSVRRLWGRKTRIVELVEKAEVEKAYSRGYKEAHEQQMQARIMDAKERGEI